eukprot:m.78382 g.78382  ORF g.78382 m.78382 type:complete len:483 (-) comp8574_c0_seq1:43-1491(-)
MADNPPFYHENISRPQAEELLKKNGSRPGLFLIRWSGKSQSHVLTIQKDLGRVVHFLMKKKRNGYEVDGMQFPNTETMERTIETLRDPLTHWKVKPILPVYNSNYKPSIRAPIPISAPTRLPFVKTPVEITSPLPPIPVQTQVAPTSLYAYAEESGPLPTTNYDDGSIAIPDVVHVPQKPQTSFQPGVYDVPILHTGNVPTGPQDSYDVPTLKPMQTSSDMEPQDSYDVPTLKHMQTYGNDMVANVDMQQAYDTPNLAVHKYENNIIDIQSVQPSSSTTNLANPNPPSKTPQFSSGRAQSFSTKMRGTLNGTMSLFKKKKRPNLLPASVDVPIHFLLSEIIDGLCLEMEAMDNFARKGNELASTIPPKDATCKCTPQKLMVIAKDKSVLASLDMDKVYCVAQSYEFKDCIIVVFSEGETTKAMVLKQKKGNPGTVFSSLKVMFETAHEFDVCAVGESMVFINFDKQDKGDMELSFLALALGD